MSAAMIVVRVCALVGTFVLLVTLPCVLGIMMLPIGGYGPSAVLLFSMSGGGIAMAALMVAAWFGNEPTRIASTWIGLGAQAILFMAVCLVVFIGGILGVAIAVSLCGLNIVALLSRPVVTQGVCGVCGYDQTGLPSDVCPECGQSSRRRSIVPGKHREAPWRSQQASRRGSRAWRPPYHLG